MSERLSPSEYVFAIAPLEREVSPMGAHDYDVPAGLYDAGSKWFFVEAVSITSGGGSYTDVYKPGVHNYGVGTSVKALWAKAKSDIPDSARPFKVGDRVFKKNSVTGVGVLGPEREVIRVEDMARGQYVWLREVDSVHFDHDGWAWGLVPA